MNNFKKITIGDVAEIKHGWAFPGSGITEYPSENVLVTPGSFKIGGGFKKDNKKFFNGYYPDEYLLTPDDLIVTMTDLSKATDTLGYSALVPNDGKKYLHNQRIGLVQIKSKTIDKNYLYWLLRTYHYQRFIAGAASGTTVKHTSPTQIKSYSFYCPPIETQKQIAGILFSFDDKIELNAKINHNLEEQIRVLFEDFFINSQHCANWKQGTIADLGNVVGGSTPSKAKPEYYTSNGIAWITPKDLSGNKSKFISKGESDITPAGLRNSSAVIMPRGTVLFSSRAPIGYIAIAKNEITTNQGFKSVVPHLHIGTAFVYCFLKHNLPKIESMASGSTFKEVSGSVMKAIPAVIPAKEALMNFSTITQPLFDQQELLESENQRLTRLRDALLPKLMAGEIDVSEVEI